MVLFFSVNSMLPAQLYPVTAQISPTGLPLDPYVHQWIDPADMMSPMQITMVLNDLNAGSLSVGIRATIQGQGVEIQSNPGVPFIMDLAPGAIVTFDQQMLGRLFSLQGLQGMTPVGGEFALPEGLYTICIEAYVLNRDVVVSNPACAVFHVQRFDVPEWLMLQPTVALPDDEFTLGQVANETAQSLIFSWSNRHPEILMAEYQLQMWEIRPDFSALTYDQLVHSTLPFFDQTVHGTQYLYSSLDPPLKPDQTYLVRLTVRDPTRTYQFVHNGVGPVASFRVLGGEEGPEIIPCLDPRNKPLLTAEEVTDDLLQLYWTVPEYLSPESFYLYGRYENGTGDWELIDRLEGSLRSFDLEWGVDAPVAVRVGFACDEESSLVYSDPWSFVPFPELLPDGCDVTLEFDVENEDILPMDLIPGDSVIVGDYVLVFDELSGDRYGYFGLGYVTTPLFGLFEPQVNVAFQNLVINTDFQMIGGSVQTIKYEQEATILDLSPLRDLLKRVSDELSYESHVIEDSIGGIRINTDGDTEILTIDSTGQVVVTTFSVNLQPPPDNAHAFQRNGYQSAGDVFLDQLSAGATTFEGPNGEIFIRVGESTHEESDLLQSEHMNDLGDLGEAIFQRHPNAPGGFDLPFGKAGATDYDSIGSYAMPWKAIRLGTSEPVDVDLSDVTAEDIRFETFTGYSLHYPEPTGDQVTLQIPSRTEGDGDAVYALGSHDGGANFQTLGGVKIAGYTLAVRTLHVISVNGAEVPVTEEELASALNKIYNPAIATWQVRFLDPVDGIEYDRDGDGAVAVGLRTGGGVDQELRDLATALEDQLDKGTKDDPIFTMVVVPKLEHDYNGYMPRGRELGFVEPIGGNAINGIHPFSRLVAHELGHGAFGLLHTWEEYPDLDQGQTDNLMDYGDGVNLHKRQWDHIHDPPTILNFLETTEGGGGIGNPTHFCIQGETLSPFEHRCFKDPSGRDVKVPDDVIQLAFYSEEDDDPTLLGRLASFSTADRRYTVSPDEDGHFQHYHDYDDQTHIYVSESGCSEGLLVKGSVSTQEYYFNDDEELKRTATYCDCNTKSPEQDLVVEICEIQGDGTYETSDVEEVVRHVQAGVNSRNALSSQIRPKESYHHLLATSGSFLGMPQSELRILDERLYLLKYYTDINFYVIFQQSYRNLSKAKATEFAYDVLEELDIPNSVIVTIPYNIIHSGDVACGSPGYATNISLQAPDEGPVAGVFEYVTRIFSTIPKPLNLTSVLLLSDGSLLEMESRTEDMVSGFDAINSLLIFESKQKVGIREHLETEPRYVGSFDPSVYEMFLEKHRTWKNQLDQLRISAFREEVEALNGGDLVSIMSPMEDPVALRESYADNWDLIMSYLEYVKVDIDNSVKAKMRESGGHYAFDDLEHLHDEIHLRDLAYNAIDVLTMALAPTGLDAIGDMAGLVFTIVFDRKAGHRYLEYGAGLVVPFAIDKLGKGSVKGYRVVRSLEDGKASYKVLESGEDISRQEEWLYSIHSARSREEATQMMLEEVQHLDEVVEGFYDGSARVFSQLDGVTVETVAQISKDILNLAPALVRNPGLLTKELAEAIVEAGTRRAEFLDEIAQLSDESVEQLVKDLGGRTDLAKFMGSEKRGIGAWETILESGLDDALRKDVDALENIRNSLDEGLDAIDVVEDAIQTLNKTRWEEIKTFFKRGNDFNRKARDEAWYDFNEVHLENGKRLDGYDHDIGEIISRKATDFDNIQPATFEKYLQEIDSKYAPGTLIRSNKYPEIDGQVLHGTKIIEVPISNQSSTNLSTFQALAEHYNTTIRFRSE